MDSLHVQSASASVAPRAGGWARVTIACLALAAVGFCFHAPVVTYVSDHHYQSHFLFLWAFFAAALIKTGRGRFAARICRGPRGVAGSVLAVLALALFHAGLVTGSSTAQRLAVVVTFVALLLLVAVGWSPRRCLGWGAFALMCFGVPYSAYFALTRIFRQSFMFVLEALPRFTPLQYEVQGLALHFDGYHLSITPDCSGFNQLVTFFGLAFLGSLTARPALRRTALLFVVGAVLAYASNVARIVGFVVLVGLEQYQFIEDPDLHSVVGFVAYAPFILGFIWLILRTHTPTASRPRGEGEAELTRLPAVALLVPFVALRLLHLAEPEVSTQEPRFMVGVDAPPGYQMLRRSPSEGLERDTYETPWLLNAAFGGPGRPAFELFSYLTRSRRHLAVHQISHCLDVPGTEVVYGDPIEVAGRTFWTLELISENSWYHGYFAFWVDGEDFDDQFGTQLEVFSRRLLGGGVQEVGLTRFLMPGPLQRPLSAADRALLAWRAGQLNGVAGPAATPR